MRKAIAIMIAAIMALSLASCGSGNENGDPTSVDAKKTAETTSVSDDIAAELKALEGVALSDAIVEIADSGYTAYYYADGVDFTEFIDDVKDDYIVDSVVVDAEDKKIDVKIVQKENDEANQSDTTANHKEEEKAYNTSSKDTSSTANTSSAPKLSLSDTMSAVDSILASNYGSGNYTMDYDSTGVVINVWEDGVAQGVVYAASGDETYKSMWDDIVYGIKDLSTSVEDAIAECGYEDMYVCINIVNDQNKDNVLLSVVSGVVIYDAVNG